MNRIKQDVLYVRDDRPFGGADQPAALFYASRDRRAEHPERHLARFAGILQTDGHGGYKQLYRPNRNPAPIRQALCWSHARRKFFELADIASSARGGKVATPISPIAFEAVKRIDVLFDIERDISEWMHSEQASLSRHAPVAKALDYLLTRWHGFRAFVDDGRICLTNNAAVGTPLGLALGRK